jgi:hypothetical protein
VWLCGRVFPPTIQDYLAQRRDSPVFLLRSAEAERV